MAKNPQTVSSLFLRSFGKTGLSVGTHLDGIGYPSTHTNHVALTFSQILWYHFLFPHLNNSTLTGIL